MGPYIGGILWILIVRMRFIRYVLLLLPLLGCLVGSLHVPLVEHPEHVDMQRYGGIVWAGDGHLEHLANNVDYSLFKSMEYCSF